MTPLPRSEFAITQRYIYLNHAAAGVLPQCSTVAIEAFVRTHADAGVLGTYPYDAALPEYREKIGRYIGAAGADIALVPNTSAAANVVALGVEWQPGDEVVLCDNEFPANAVPWIALRRRGVAVRLLSTQRQRLTPEALSRQLSPRTRAVALSWVSYGDGYRHDLRALVEVAHRADALLCVDAMQGLGAFPLDVCADGVDALYAGGAKWMLGLHGVGFLYVRRQLGERLRLAMPGWRSLQDMWDFHDYDQPYASDAMRFEGGTPNLIGALSLVSSIGLFERSGPPAIAQHILDLTDRLCEGLHDLGAEICSVRGEGVSSGIVTFRFPGRDSVAVGQALLKEGIITTHRSEGVRVSPHGYNTPEEIDAALEALKRQLRAPVRT
ncbi:MAG: aminotransferase class V-fold PLP-dependent enzyme [Candidatus Eremiobacteraeota bacterium]|nr:aminotransferase class V-fold PLP-dependent enzyme [Candidatus Eremiobacteraeota bacterium]MBV8499210.1 aminotransferase class V-fold PLP-dependent enzyme [Candidatus Eremiobacteraeota bacterium]